MAKSEETSAGEGAIGGIPINIFTASVNAGALEVMGQAIHLALAAQKAVVQNIPFNSVSRCPTVEPSFHNLGRVSDAHELQ